MNDSQSSIRLFLRREIKYGLCDINKQTYGKDVIKERFQRIRKLVVHERGGDSQ